MPASMGGGGWRWRRHRLSVLFGVTFLRSVLLLTEFFLCGDIVEAVAEDAGFHGEGAVEAPLVGGDAQDQCFFAVADGAEASEEIVEEQAKIFGIFAGEEVLVGAQAVFKGIAAGCGLTFGSARAGRLGRSEERRGASENLRDLRRGGGAGRRTGRV